MRTVETTEAEDIRSAPWSEEILFQQVAEVFTVAAQRGSGGGNPFEAAVQAYLSRHPELSRDAAAKVVAHIICRR